MEQRVLVARVVAVAVLVIALAVALTTLTGGGGYVVTAQFRDAGQLVKGGLVQVAGRGVGKISDIRLSDDGLAEVEMDLEDGQQPLHRGTKATIRTVGLSGIANRYVELEPGPETGEEIPDGGQLSITETDGIVDLDAVLSSLDPTTRKRLQSLLRNGGKLFDDGAASASNDVLRYLNPALAQTRALAEELTRDTAAFSTLVSASSQTVEALASRRGDLAGALTGTAGTLRALASEQEAVGSILERAPGASRQLRASLRRIGQTFDVARPAVRDLRAASPSLARLLRRLPTAAGKARPVLADLRAALPDLDATLRKVPALERVALPALRSTTKAIGEGQPVFEGLRPYAMDLVGGLFTSFGGTAGAFYDANGHFARVSLQTGGASGSGVLSLFGGGNLPGLTPQTFVNARCPGTAARPAADGSNPYVPAEGLCDPSEVRP